MTIGCKVTELFCIKDEFYNYFNAVNADYLLEAPSGFSR